MARTFLKASPADLGEAERILRSAFTPYIRRLGREIAADAYAFLVASIDRGDVYLAMAGGRTVGVAVTERRA